jgi:hypothetical protein
MHWLLLLALLSSTTDLRNGGSPNSLNQLAETSLRRQLGSVRNVDVQVVPRRSGASRSLSGDFDSFTVSLDGFSADRLMGLAERADDSGGAYSPSARGGSSSGNTGYGYPRDDEPSYQVPRRLDSEELGDILGNIGGGRFGGVLDDILGGSASGSGGRIGRVRLRATNFTFQGARYDALSADLGEIRFDWKKALRGDFDVRSISPGALSLSLKGEQAARLLAPRLPSLSDVRVRFADGRAFVGAKSGLYGVRVPFEVGARLSVRQNRVMATDFAASVARLRLPSFVVSELTRGVNPLYDFDPQNRWPLAINLSTAQASANTLAMRGGIQWIGFNNSRRDHDQTYRDDSSRYPDSRGEDVYDDEDGYGLPNERDSRDSSSRGRSTQDILGDIFGR